MRVMSLKGLEARKKATALPEVRAKAAKTLREHYADPAFKAAVIEKRRQWDAKHAYPTQPDNAIKLPPDTFDL